MDVVESVRRCLSKWDKDGEAECLSILVTPHSNPTDPASNDLLTTVYHTLITSTLLTWHPKASLSSTAFVQFVQSVLDSLPSSSSDKPPSVVAFGELLVDVFWTVDVELEDVHSDAKLALANAEQGNVPAAVDGADAAAVIARVAQVKQDAEADKDTVAGIVKALVGAGVLDATVCRERLELSLIHHAGLIADDQAFSKKEVRMRTALFYKQNKFNLLREQSEGYSKLTAELTSSIGPAHSVVDGSPVESLSAIEARARPAWERVVGLVGYFDLDPNRALDIILDVFSVHLATHYSFFLALLSNSPWATTAKTSEDSMAVEHSVDVYRGKDLDEVLRLAEIQAGVPREPQMPAAMGANNCRVLAQVLGFKFAYYQGGDVTEQTPRTLYLTAALLIREGFITLEDLYPHISPSDAQMEDVRKQYLASIDSRIAGAKTSMLAMAAPLESVGSAGSTLPRPSTPADLKKSELKEIPNQKLGLLHALLSLGALRPAVALLSKFPWMVDAFPELADLLLRILKHSISGLYDSTCTSGPDKSSFTRARARFATAGVVAAQERRPHITLQAPTPPGTSSTNFVFFFPQWTERVPVCSSADDVVDVVEPLLNFVGVHVSRDVNFFAKFLRIGRNHLGSTAPIDPETKKPSGTPDPEHPVRQFWYKVTRRYLLPALPLIRGNAVCTVEVWNIVRQYEVTLRWRLYGEMKTSTYTSHAELRVRAIQADRESKGILRRLSMQTIDSLAGAVAKLAHSDPCILFTNAVTQIMAYENIANCIVQALNYVTVMGFDVLLYIMLEALANPNKDRVKHDGVNISDWLQNLTSFSGRLFRRYSTDLTPMLRYVVHQLHNGQTTEIVVLREIIRHMAGISPLPNLTDSQIVAMAGGPHLRIEAVSSVARGARLDPGDMALKGPQRLSRALQDSQLALPLLIQLAQQRQKCVFQPPSPNAPLKSLGSLYDTCHGVLLQYLEFLTSPSVLPSQEYLQKLLPPLVKLNKTYGISVEMCMHMIRPVLHSALLSSALDMSEKDRQASEEAEKRLKAALTAKREPAASSSRVGSPAVGESTIQAETKITPAADDVVMDTAEVAQPPQPENPWQPELFALFEEVKEIAPPAAMDIIGIGFYFTFWQMSTYDISPPIAKYEEENANLRALSRQEDAKYISADRSSDRTKRQTAIVHRNRRDRYNAFTGYLTTESKQQMIAMGYTKKRLTREKQHWFPHNPKGATLASALVQYCLHPRALLSPMDADYCAQIIKVIHSLGTPGFSTLNTYDKVLSEHVKAIIFSCSEYEAQNYGRFLLGILTDLYKWHQDEQLFLTDNRSKGAKPTCLPGFMLRFSSKTTVAPDDLISWQDFRGVCRKWHRKILKCIIECIETGEYMHIYNSIVVLREILPMFPIAAVHEAAGPSLQHAIDKFVEKEKRNDLKVFGSAFAAGLKRREAFWAPPMKAVKPVAPVPSVKSTPIGTPAPVDRSRNGTIPTAPSADTRRPVVASSTPSGPRAKLTQTNGNAASSSDVNTTASSVKQAMESVPRPEVVKRIRPDTKSPAPKVNGTGDVSFNAKSEPMALDAPQLPVKISQPPASVPPTGPRKDEQLPRGPAASTPRPSTPQTQSPKIQQPAMLPAQPEYPRPPTPALRSSSGKELPQSPRAGTNELKGARSEASQAMPPPVNPSQTLSAQELRDFAKHSRPADKGDEKPSRSQQVPSAPATTSTRRRTPSPPSRPGTRNASSDSRASGGRSRTATNETERAEEKRGERESRHEPREGRREAHGRGDRSNRSNRESDREDRPERDRERGRDRHGDKERPRDRERDRDKEHRERDKDRDRERDKDRDRDRHRREDKDRDREGRKDRESVARTSAIILSPGAPAVEDRSRPDTSRRRDSQAADDALGKRRRPTDDESDRASKRPSRKESHHEDRSRRDKDGHERTRDSERRRKEREQPDTDARPLTIDTKLSDKRIPEGPASASSRALPPTTPSAPRAMSTTDTSRKSERDWRRDQPSSSRTSPSGVTGSSIQPQESSSQGSGSLRSRISDEKPGRSAPQGPASYRKEGDGHSDGGRKRASSERETGDSPANGDPAPSKRFKVDRNRYASRHDLVKKHLPTTSERGTRSSRKD